MNPPLLKKSEKAMQDAWINWFEPIDEEDVPMINFHFEKAWRIQQIKIEQLELKIKAMQSSIRIAAKQLRIDERNLDHPVLNDLADLLSTVARITEPK